MNDDREARLTAFALNDAGLSPATRQEIESLLATDPAARQAVEETRNLANVLTAGLAAEQAALPASAGVTIPATKAKPSKQRRWAQLAAAAAAVLMAVGGSFLAGAKWKLESDRAHAMGQIGLASEAQTRVSRDSGQSEPGRNHLSSDQASLSAPALDEHKRLTDKLGGVYIDNGGETHASGNVDGKFFDPASPPGSRGPADVKTPNLDLQTKEFPGGPFAGSGFRIGMPRPPIPLRPGNINDPKKQAAGEALPRGDDPQPGVDLPPPPPQDRHLALIENAFTIVKGQDALSTFGVDVDTASYSIVRKYLTSGQLPPSSAVRLEEMVNYFPYTDKPPTGDEPFAVTVEMADCPWAPTHRLARLGLKAKPIDKDKRPPSNLVFLIDVSGSMFSPERLPLVKASLKLLVNQLGESDRIAMVAYAGHTGLVLDSTSVQQKDKIIDALDRLEAGGSTNGSSGIQQAYEVAQAHFIKGGTNRVILCTDGDWNVGVTSTDALMKLIEQKRETGVFLSVCGFGFGNLRDEMMVQLAGKGNGNYAYIDTLKEAHKTFVEQLGGTLVTVAKDVKIQIEFNPAVVQSYRLLGYEKRILAVKDFHDDTKDSGEMGAGHVVTALYELVPAGVVDPAAGKVDGLRYQNPDPKPVAKGIKTDEAFVVKMRHKKPDADVSTLRELTVKNETKPYEKASEDFQFAASVASFAMILRDSQYKGDSKYGLVLELAAQATKHDPSGYRAEFVELVKKAKTLAGK